MMGLFPVLLNFALYIIVADSELPSLIANSKGCWSKCGGGGSCPNVCGDNGYCCRQGYKDCPEVVAKFNPNKQHACISVPDPVFIPKTEGCWLKCNGGGLCTKTCKTNGYCCRKGYKDCPESIAKFNPKAQHACIFVPPERKAKVKPQQERKAKVKPQQGEKGKCAKADNTKYVKDCKRWAAIGECNKKSATWMKKNCACSCEKVKRGKKCYKDDVKEFAVKCIKWAATGECNKKSANWMKQNCACSCEGQKKKKTKKCPKADNPKYAMNCKRWAESLECEKTNSVWMKKNCACSCNTGKTVKKRLKKNCGLPLNRGRIVGGVAATLGEWPWQIGIVKITAKSIVKCGGTLITSRAILTAAHCFPESTPDASQYAVRIGDLNLDETEDGEEIVNIVKIIKHQKFSIISYVNDITVLILEKDVTQKSYVGTACLSVDDIGLPDGKKCVITGWGLLKDEYGGVGARILQKTEVPTISRKVCNKAYERLGKDSVTKGMFCAGYKKGGKDACQGDSGGPLVCRSSKGRFFLHGVISWGAGCAKPGFYGVYTKVSHYTAWIDKALNSK